MYMLRTWPPAWSPNVWPALPNDSASLKRQQHRGCVDGRVGPAGFRGLLSASANIFTRPSPDAGLTGSKRHTLPLHRSTTASRPDCLGAALAAAPRRPVTASSKLSPA